MKDSKAAQLLQEIFLETQDLGLRLEIVDRLLGLITGPVENKAVLEDLRTLPVLVKGMPEYPGVLQEELLRVSHETGKGAFESGERSFGLIVIAGWILIGRLIDWIFLDRAAWKSSLFGSIAHLNALTISKGREVLLFSICTLERENLAEAFRSSILLELCGCKVLNCHSLVLHPSDQ